MALDIKKEFDTIDRYLLKKIINHFNNFLPPKFFDNIPPEYYYKISSINIYNFDFKILIKKLMKLALLK